MSTVEKEIGELTDDNNTKNQQQMGLSSSSNMIPLGESSGDFGGNSSRGSILSRSNSERLVVASDVLMRDEDSISNIDVDSTGAAAAGVDSMGRTIENVQRPERRASQVQNVKGPMLGQLRRTSTIGKLGTPPPKSFYCPLTMSVMKDPVVDYDGNTYENAAITAWLTKHDTSPVTRKVLTEKHLFPNRALRDTIFDFMGHEWSKEAEEVLQTGTNEFTPPEPTHRQISPTDFRGIIDGFLQEISEAVGKTIRLNNDGICAFTYEQLTIVIEVPETVGSFFIYTSCIGLNKYSDNPDVQHSIKDLAMRLNYLQQETRGGCLSCDPINDEIMFSYTDRCTEINSTDFRNILENFIDTALNMYNKFVDIVTTNISNNDNNNTNNPDGSSSSLSTGAEQTAN